jgi:hypothetical protein
MIVHELAGSLGGSAREGVQLTTRPPRGKDSRSLVNSYNRRPLGCRIAKRKEGNQMTLSRKTFWIGGGLVALAVLIVVLVLVYSGGGNGGGGY